MKKLFLFISIMLFFTFVGAAGAVPVFYVNNPSGNSTDWAAAVIGLGGTINSNVNFDSHSLGVLNPNFYTTSDGITLSTTGPLNTVSSGAGPGQSNTAGTQPGEGLHPSSNYLFGSSGSKSLTISFAQPVFGAGLFTIDYFDTSPSDRMQIQAFSGTGGTGTLLGSAISVNQNFQLNKLYFMGVSDSVASIGSLVFTYNGSTTGDTIGIDDIRFATSTAVPEPATMLLLGSGLVGFAGYRKRFRKN